MKIPTLDSAKKHIDTMDFSLVIHRMITHFGWLKKEAEAAVELYRHYLFLIKKHKQSFPPTEEIDAIWHQHILHTQQYHQDCRAIFGKYLHHTPQRAITQQASDQYCTLQRLHLEEYGDYIYQLRGFLSCAMAFVRCFFMLKNRLNSLTLQEIQ